MYVVSLNGDKLHRIDFFCLNVPSPKVELIFNNKNLKNEELIYRSYLSSLNLGLYCDTLLNRDLIELPVYSIGKLELIHNRGRRTISQSTSMAALNTMANQVASGDEVIIYITSYTYANACNNIIENRTSITYRLKIK